MIPSGPGSTRLRAEAFIYLAFAVNPSAGEGPAVSLRRALMIAFAWFES
jgi:hypothetical protein